MKKHFQGIRPYLSKNRLLSWLASPAKIILKKIFRFKTYYEYLSYFDGKCGLEIGGPSQIFTKNEILPVYPLVKDLHFCNFNETTIWQQGISTHNKGYRYGEDKEGCLFVCEATDLGRIPSESYDFILASHVLEHIANPLKAMKEWVRVLKNDGVMLLILPDKKNNFDRKRQVVSFAHLIHDLKSGVGEDDMAHLPEILEFHDVAMDKDAGGFDSFKERSARNYENRCLHHHVFDEKIAKELFEYFKLKLLRLEFVLPYHMIALARKVAVDTTK